MDEPLEMAVYHDVLCSWCYLASRRLLILRDEYGDALRWSYRAFPLRPEDQLPTARERQIFARHYRRISKEPEAKGVVPDLWLSDDPPRSTLPPLVAAEAALSQGERAQHKMLEAMRHAAFMQGMNIARRDVILDLAERCGLKLDKFMAAFDAPATERKVREDYDEAKNHRIRGVPAVVIGGEWLLSGARDLDDYRATLDRYRQQHGGGTPERLLH